MKRKMFVLLLVMVGLSVLVVEGVSQPPDLPREPPASPPTPSQLRTPAPAPTPTLVPDAKPNFSAVQPPQQEWSFEQLVEALKGVRARQKELLAQEADLLAQMEKKVEEKRHDLGRAEATLQRLQENGRVFPRKDIGERKEEKKKEDLRDDKR